MKGSRGKRKREEEVQEEKGREEGSERASKLWVQREGMQTAGNYEMGRETTNFII